MESYEFPLNFKERLEEDCNLGLLITKEHIVLDIDNKTSCGSNKETHSTKTGLQDFVSLASQHVPIETLTALTPSGGKHIYFKLTGAEGEEKLKNWNYGMQFETKVIAVDIRVSGGYITCPPSKMIDSDKCYRWENDNYKVPIAPLPLWILHNILDTRDSNASSNGSSVEGMEMF